MLGRNLLAIGISVVALMFVAFLVKQEGLGERDSQPLVGTWQLIDEQAILSDGRVVTSGASSPPVGILIYDDSGHVASQLFRPNTKGTASSNEATLRQYEGYFGTYAVDNATKTITCHVHAALPSENEGKDISEQFSIAGDELTTQSPTIRPDGTRVTHVLVWTRLNTNKGKSTKT